MVNFGDVPACSGKDLSHFVSLCPMHIPRESWRVFGSMVGNFLAFRHQLDVKNLLVPPRKVPNVDRKTRLCQNSTLLCQKQQPGKLQLYYGIVPDFTTFTLLLRYLDNILMVFMKNKDELRMMKKTSIRETTPN